MNLNLVNDFFSGLKDNKFMQNFRKELSNYLENNVTDNSKTVDNDYEWNNLLSDDLILYDNKIITKYKEEMLIQRNNILQNYAESTREKGDMLYIYNISTNQTNSYNICNFTVDKRNQTITKPIEELPKEVSLGSILRKQGDKFILDLDATKIVGQQINEMIKEKIQEQSKYLTSKRIEGHIYEIQEKYSGRIWLYDLNNIESGGIEGVEEIEFPKNLYENAKEGDKYIYKEGKYQAYLQS